MQKLQQIGYFAFFLAIIKLVEELVISNKDNKFRRDT